MCLIFFIHIYEIFLTMMQKSYFKTSWIRPFVRIRTDMIWVPSGPVLPPSFMENCLLKSPSCTERVLTVLSGNLKHSHVAPATLLPSGDSKRRRLDHHQLVNSPIQVKTPKFKRGTKNRVCTEVEGETVPTKTVLLTSTLPACVSAARSTFNSLTTLILESFSASKVSCDQTFQRPLKS